MVIITTACVSLRTLSSTTSLIISGGKGRNYGKRKTNSARYKSSNDLKWVGGNDSQLVMRAWAERGRRGREGGTVTEAAIKHFSGRTTQGVSLCEREAMREPVTVLNSTAVSPNLPDITVAAIHTASIFLTLLREVTLWRVGKQPPPKKAINCETVEGGRRSWRVFVVAADPLRVVTRLYGFSKQTHGERKGGMMMVMTDPGSLRHHATIGIFRNQTCHFSRGNREREGEKKHSFTTHYFSFGKRTTLPLSLPTTSLLRLFFPQYFRSVNKKKRRRFPRKKIQIGIIKKSR